MEKEKSVKERGQCYSQKLESPLYRSEGFLLNSFKTHKGLMNKNTVVPHVIRISCNNYIT